MNKTLVHVLKEHSRRIAERRALVFLGKGDAEFAEFTYGTLHDHAVRIARLLRNAGVRRGEPVLLLFPPGLDFAAGLFGCMFAGAIAVPTTDPARLGKTATRLASIVADVRPRVGLTVSSVLATRDGQLSACDAGAAVHWVAVDDHGSDIAAPDELLEPDPDSIALIQYSSGSTSAPKGVVLTHRNLVCAEAMIEDAFGAKEESIFAGWLPPYHDMGLIGLMLHPIYLGAQCILLSPHEYLRRPFRWLKAVSDFRATASVAPNFAFDLCAARVTESERETLDLSSLQVLVNGAEPVRQQTIDRFCEKFEPVGFRRSAFSPCYGLAEATLLVSACRPKDNRSVRYIDAAALQERRVALAPQDTARSHAVVSCGRPPHGINVAIVDPDTGTECPYDRVGEIWVSGASVAGSYWGKAELSQRTFCSQLPSRQGQAFLRTGDLGFFLDGGLFVTGRLSDVVVIRGRNIYPEDVERTAENAHLAALPHASAAFSIETADEERLVLVVEVRRSPSLDYPDVAATLRRAIAIEHEIEAYAIVLVRSGTIPRTSSGKIRRKACREAWLAGALSELYRRQHRASRDGNFDLPQREELLRLPAATRFVDVRNTLRQAIAHLIHVSPEDLNGTMLDCGLDSVLAIKLQHQLEKRLGISLSTSEVAQSTIDQLTDKLLQSVARPPDIDWSPPMRQEPSFRLTPGQQALWFEYQRDPTGSAYHIGGAIRIRGRVSPPAFRRALEALLLRHPSLRSVFDVGESGPEQHVLTDLVLPLASVNVAGWTDDQLLADLNEEFNRPFNLSGESPVRTKLYERSASEYVVSLVVHHLVADFASLETLIEEWMRLYRAEAEGTPHLLPDVPVPYCAYVHWCEQFQAGPEAVSLQSYWNEQLRGDIPALELPQFRARPSAARRRGAQRVRMLDRSLTEAVKTLARREGVTSFAVLFACFNILLHRYTGQTDIAVGTPVSVRPGSAFDRTIGYFANTVVLRSEVNADSDCASLLQQVQTAVWSALDHAKYPFSWIAQERRRNGLLDAASALQTMFVYYAQTGSNPGLGRAALQAPSYKIDMAGCEITTIPLQRLNCQFDLCLAIAECGSEMACSLDYDTELLAEEDVDRMFGHYATVLEGVTRNASMQIAQVPLLTEAEVRCFEAWNATAKDYAEPHVLHELVEAQAVRTPQAVALSCDGRSMTYAEVSTRSTALALELMACGAARQRPVAVMLHPGPEMVVGLLGIIKAGAAYIPIDPDDGSQRVERILASTCPALILTTSELRDRLPSGTAPVCCFDCRGVLVSAGDKRRLPQPTPDDLAYIILTSGSTGEPKGAMISHRAICNRLLWMRDQYPLTASDRILQKTPYTFDVSVWEIFLPLIAGCEIVIARPGALRDLTYLTKLICERDVTTVHFVPSMLRLFLQEPNVEKCASLRRIFASGEALTRDLVDLFARRLSAELHNLYGPTEAAVDVTYWPCARDQAGPVPIGYPIANIQLYVLDEHRNRVPVGVPGELYIGGTGLAEGYWRQPRLTQANFVSACFIGGHRRVYRTGDRARYRADGSLEFLGRLDRQVKIRGIRVEPGEVEAALRRHSAVVDCVVIGDAPDGQNTQLIAYLVVRHEAPTTGEMRRFLRHFLPDFFLPAQFRIVDALPRTSSGKLNPNALSTDASCRPLTEGEELGTPEEMLLARIWSDVLSVPNVKITENFFERGGDSLRSLQVQARLLQAGYRIDVEQLFKSPTIRELAAHVKPVKADAPGLVTQPFGLVSEQARELLEPRFTDAFPLSRLQEVLLFHSENDSDYEIYLLSITVNAAFDDAAMRHSLDVLARRHEMLRVSYLLEFDCFLQVVHRSVAIPLTVCDLTSHGAAEQERILDAWIDSERRHRFDWTKPPLIRIRVDRRTSNAFQLTVSHALYDGWSLMSMIVELLQEYIARQSGASSPLAPAPRSYYRDFVAAEQATINSRAAGEFWRTKLDNANNCYIGGPLTSSDAGPARSRRKVALPAKTVDGLRALARTAQVPLKSVLLAAHLRVISLLTGEPDVMTGLITNGRLEQPDGDRAVGLFLNTVPLRVHFGGESWTEMVRAVFLAEQQLWPFRRFPLAEIRRLVAKTLFDTAFNFVDIHVVDQLRGREELQVSGWKNPSDLTFFPLCAYFTEDPVSSALLFSLDYDKRYFADDDVEKKLAYYLKTLEAAAFTPDAAATQAQLLADSELAQMCPWRNQPAEWASWPDVPIHRLFSACARSHSQAIAVVGEDGQLSYSDLEKRANRLARCLLRSGATAEMPIGVWVGRTSNLVVALLGILKAGAAFVPISGALPSERLLDIKRDCGFNLLVADRSFPEAALGHDVTTIRIDSGLIERFTDDDPLTDTGPNALAYIMYTSGSTGEPKGVEVTHGNLANVVRSIGERIAISSSDTWLAVTSLSFDISLSEIFLPLVSGARVVIAESDEVRDGRRLAQLLSRTGATIMQATPSGWRLLLDAGWSGSRQLRILSGGEALSRTLADQLLSRVSAVWNVYGPTETAIWSTCAKLGLSNTEDPDIGDPLANTSVYVLDSALQQLPTGVCGELYIGGSGVARGYRNRPDLTAERFYSDPFSGSRNARMYRTGDRVRMRPDGSLKFLGRLDGQIKIRGFRVETAEIESVLQRHPDVQDAIVGVRTVASDDARLIAVLRAASKGEPDIAEMRKYAASLLPAYMCPAEFIFVSSFPLTPNGKVDRSALLARDTFHRTTTSSAPSEAATVTERTLAEIWKDLLHVDTVAHDANFFDIGGHSLLLMRASVRIQKIFGIHISPTDLFKYPTIGSLATHLDSSGPEPTPDFPLAVRRLGDLPLPLLEVSSKRRQMWTADVG